MLCVPIIGRRFSGPAIHQAPQTCFDTAVTDFSFLVLCGNFEPLHRRILSLFPLLMLLPIFFRPAALHASSVAFILSAKEFKSTFIIRALARSHRVHAVTDHAAHVQRFQLRRNRSTATVITSQNQKTKTAIVSASMRKFRKVKPSSMKYIPILP